MNALNSGLGELTLSLMEGNGRNVGLIYCLRVGDVNLYLEKFMSYQS
jgi:hypothetical protein